MLSSIQGYPVNIFRTYLCFLCSTSNAISVKSKYDSFTFHQQLLEDFQSQLHSFMAQGLPESSRLICFQFSPITKIFDRSVPGLHTKIWFYQPKTINQTQIYVLVPSGVRTYKLPLELNPKGSAWHLKGVLSTGSIFSFHIFPLFSLQISEIC